MVQVITSSGFQMPTRDELIQSYLTDAAKEFGDDFNLAEHDPVGIFMRLFALHDYKKYQQMQNVYYDGYLPTASDEGLDYLASNQAMSRSAAQVATTKLTFTGEVGFQVDAGSEFSTDDGIVFVLTEDVILTDSGTKDDLGNAIGTGSGSAESEEFEDYVDVDANTIINVDAPDEQLYSVTNSQAATGGTSEELQEDFRTRLMDSNQGIITTTTSGLKAALNNVAGVRDSNVVENTTDTVDAYGNPADSIHIYVLGGSSLAIANAIQAARAAGTQTVGQQLNEVTDAGGTNKYPIRFDYATPVPITVNLSLTVTEEFNEDDTDTLIDDVLTYFDSLKMGALVRFSYLYSYIWQIHGIAGATIQLARDAGKPTEQDVQLTPFEAVDVTRDDLINVTTSLQGGD